MTKLKLIANLIINLFSYLITKCIPKKDDLWIFSAWFGERYSDNPKAFFEFVNQHHSQKIDAVWITKSNNVKQELQSKGYTVYLEKSLVGIWIQLRANKVFICQSLHDDVFSPCIGNKTEVVQLWHGIPLKKIMFDVFDESKKNKNLTGRIFDWLAPYNKHRNDILVATSELTREILAKAFRLPTDSVLSCGFPRNDVFFDQKKGDEKDIFKCIYMPTFRGGKNTECNLFETYGFNFEKMEAEFVKHNIQLVLRMHPVNKPPFHLVEQIKHSSVIKFDAGEDIYQSINQYDCLITDYSSIYFDFLLSNKPIVFAPFDLEEYKKRERSLYFDFEEVTLKPYCYNWADVLKRLISLKNQTTSLEYDKKYRELKTRFHDDVAQESSPFSNKLYKKLTDKKKDM